MLTVGYARQMPSVTRRPQPKREHTRQQRREEMERRLLDATERLMRGGASFTELSVDRLSTEADAAACTSDEALIATLNPTE